MKWSFAFAAGAAAAVLLGVMPGCSSNTVVVPNGGASTCDSTQCLPGNACITIDGETKCRKSCSSNTDPGSSCPFGYTCAGPSTATCTPLPDETSIVCGKNFQAGPRGGAFFCPSLPPMGCTASDQAGKYCCPDSVCAKDNGDIKKAPTGQWGARCNPTGKIEGNPDCDSAQGFVCFGTSPSDADSYCTRFDCTTDRDCAAGFYCGDANARPNIENTTLRPGETLKVCQRRAYCSPCTSDLDCPARNGVPHRCVPDDDFKGFCAPECATTASCGNDAKCIDAGIGVKTCYPRAGRCVGDGSLCSPCRSDVDCGEDGACVKGQYTTEKSCAKKSAISCKEPPRGEGQRSGRDFQCPTVASPPKTPVLCLGGFAFENVPAGYCHGIYAFGEGGDVGCWSAAR